MRSSRRHLIHRIACVLVLTVLNGRFANGQDQTQTSRTAWEDAKHATQHQAFTAKVQRIAGVAMIFGGSGLTIYGLNSRYQPPSFSTCHPAVYWIYFPNNEPCRPTAPRERRASKPLVFAGAGVTSAGIVLTWLGSSHQKHAKDRLEELERIGQERGWVLSVQPAPKSSASLQIAYRW